MLAVPGCVQRDPGILHARLGLGPLELSPEARGIQRKSAKGKMVLRQIMGMWKEAEGLNTFYN